MEAPAVRIMPRSGSVSQSAADSAAKLVDSVVETLAVIKLPNFPFVHQGEDFNQYFVVVVPDSETRSPDKISLDEVRNISRFI